MYSNFRPVTLVNMIVDLSLFLAQESESEYTSQKEWEDVKVQMDMIVNILFANVGNETNSMLEESGADMEFISFPWELAHNDFSQPCRSTK